MNKLERADLDRLFPPPEDLIEAEWAPIRLEPIRDSGECLTVGLVVIANGKATVRTAPRLDRLAKLYGKNGKGLKLNVELLINIVRDSITFKDENFVKDYISDEGRQVGALRIDPLYPITGRNLDEICLMAFRDSSSFADWKIEEEIDDKVKLAEIKKFNKLDRNKIVIITRNIVIGRNIGLTGYFIKHSPIKYTSPNLAADFAIIKTNNRTEEYLDKTRSQILQMSTYKINHKDIHRHYELILCLPREEWLDKDQAKKIKDNVDRVKEDSSTHEVTLTPVSSPEEAGEHILKIEERAA